MRRRGGRHTCTPGWPGSPRSPFGPWRPWKWRRSSLNKDLESVFYGLRALKIDVTHEEKIPLPVHGEVIEISLFMASLFFKLYIQLCVRSCEDAVVLTGDPGRDSPLGPCGPGGPIAPGRPGSPRGPSEPWDNSQIKKIAPLTQNWPFVSLK